MVLFTIAGGLHVKTEESCGGKAPWSQPGPPHHVSSNLSETKTEGWQTKECNEQYCRPSTIGLNRNILYWNWHLAMMKMLPFRYHSAWALYWPLAPGSSCLAEQILGGSRDGSRNWPPATHLGNLNWASGPQLWSLCRSGIWGVN